LFEDEFSLSNTATVSYQWAVRGQQPKVICKQRHRERQSVFGTVNPESGQIVISFADKGNSTTFKKHLRKVVKAFNGKKIILILDNVRYHHAKKLAPFLEKHKDHLELLFLPPYCPDLNPIERVWWFMRKKITHNRYLESLTQRKAKFWMMFSHFIQPNDQLKNICVLN
jgi:transposase